MTEDPDLICATSAEARHSAASPPVGYGEDLHNGVLAVLLDIMVEAIVTVDGSQRIVLFNRGAEAIFGYTAPEVLGEPLDILLPEDVRLVHRQHVAAFASGPVAAQRMGERAEVRGRRRNGEIFPAEASIAKIDVGGHSYFTAVLRDVSERHRAEAERERLYERERVMRAAAEAAEQRASFLAEAGQTLNSSLDYEHTLRHLVRSAVPFLADFALLDVVEPHGIYRRLEVVHAQPAQTDIVSALRAHQIDAKRPHLTRDAIDRGETTVITEVTDEYLRSVAQCDEHLTLLRALELRSLMVLPLVVQGDVIGAVAFGSASAHRRYGPADLALGRLLVGRAELAVDHARAHRSARQAIQAREEVLSIVAHDLRNPLSVVSMCAATLEESVRDSQTELANVVSTISQSANWMNRLIQDLLDVTRIDAGQLVIARQPEDLVRVVAEAMLMLEPLAAEKGIRIIEDLPEHLPPVLADAGRVTQALSNLVGNAVKFTPRGGTITVIAEPTATEVGITVRDTGCGIAPEHLPHLFDRFWQGSAYARRHGAGLGLAIARGIVEAHGGRIWAESEVGRGTELIFTLPIAVATASPLSAV